MTEHPRLRLATSADQDGIISLIDTVYREYGDTVCLEGAESDLLDIDKNYFQQGGSFVVLEDSRGTIAGTHAFMPLDDRPGICTFRRLYLQKELRGGESGEKLMTWAIETATENSFHRVEFWSDVRFQRAHRFFARLGFKQTGEERKMLDGNTPYSEFRFVKDL